MRLQIKLTIQKEVINGAILQQATVVEYIIRNQQCKTCQSHYAQGVWQAVVQVRQHVSHKRTFYYLEQLLLKNNAHADCLQIMVRTSAPILCLSTYANSNTPRHYIYLHLDIHTDMCTHTDRYIYTHTQTYTNTPHDTCLHITL